MAGNQYWQNCFSRLIHFFFLRQKKLSQFSKNTQKDKPFSFEKIFLENLFQNEFQSLGQIVLIYKVLDSLGPE